jgi:hypothetical protein
VELIVERKSKEVAQERQREAAPAVSYRGTVARRDLKLGSANVFLGRDRLGRHPIGSLDYIVSAYADDPLPRFVLVRFARPFASYCFRGLARWGTWKEGSKGFCIINLGLPFGRGMSSSHVLTPSKVHASMLHL